MEEADVGIVIARLKADRTLGRNTPQVPQPVVADATAVEDATVVLTDAVAAYRGNGEQRSRKPA